MTRNEAKVKIEKLLNLAKNHAAAPGESANAFELAEKLAAKYGFNIKQNATTEGKWDKKPTKQYLWKAPEKKAYHVQVETLAWAMQMSGMKVTLMTNAKGKATAIYYDYEFAINTLLDKLYKHIVKVCDTYKKMLRENPCFGHMSGQQRTKAFFDRCKEYSMGHYMQPLLYVFQELKFVTK